VSPNALSQQQPPSFVAQPGSTQRRTRKTNMEAINARDASSGFARAAAPTFLSGQIFATALQNTDQRLLVSRRWSARI